MVVTVPVVLVALVGGAFWATCTGPTPVIESQPVCPAEALGERFGTKHLMWGGQMTDESFGTHAFGLRYRYVAGPVPSETCDDCRACDIDGVPCANPDGCGWWGCWQHDILPPGRVASDFASNNNVPTLITYYTWLAVSGGVEGESELAALADEDRVASWLGDLRFFTQTLSDQGPVIVHMEPDLLGFLHKSGRAPSDIPVALSGVPECADLPNTAASLMPCWGEIVDEYAPEALLGIHVSAWGHGADLMRHPGVLNPVEHATQTASFLQSANLTGDLLVVEASDRDSGFNGQPWTDTQPSLDRALIWASTLTKTTELPHLWWQIPMGTPELDNTCGRYVDDRVLRFVEARHAVAAAGAIGVVFGAGTECMTSPETDDGAFLRAIAPALSDPTPLCGP